MIYLRAIGGLGNQMFQIAFARYLSLKYNKEIFIDVSSYKNYKIRNFSLDNLYISDFYTKGKKLPFPKGKLYSIRSTQVFYRVLNKFLRVVGLNEKIEKPLYNYFVKKGLYYNLNVPYFQSPNESRIDKFVFGYFQSEKYFEDTKNIIEEELRVKVPPTDQEEVLLNEIKENLSIGVSMRLGDDYLNNSSLNVCNEDYYLKGISYLLKKYPGSKVYVFSDDIERAKNIIKDKYSVIYIEGFKDYQSLRLLYSCHHFVIANSSFSWWGAYLSKWKDKVVISPSKWYNSKGFHGDIYTDEMIKIKV